MKYPTGPVYEIVKFEYPDCFFPVEVVKQGLTLNEAQAHCQRDDTHEEGKWFHGYREQATGRRGKLFGTCGGKL